MTRIAIHDRIRGDIEGRIMSGTWEAGHRLPPEHAFMEEYGCSRMTVHKAIDGLVDRGLIERRKRAGSFVAAPKAHRAALEIPDVAGEIRGQGKDYRLGLIARVEREADGRDRELLEIESGPVLSLQCLHRADGKPFALEERLISLAAVPAARAVDFAQESPGAWLLAHVPWTDARHRITAIAATRPIAERLAVPLGSPCLSVERWTWRSDARITYARQVYPGDRHALIASFLA
ncbi:MULTISPECIES: histidine utilization repressor [unclassified Sphingomonas]|uniref:histidine utilization repressor n=1 Tax=unclassified Sphingomonas TaxID=196159 RepID=UPI0006F45999|nr:MULTISPECIES: histidine utilization repressor [unclassified Sphingomonas]KQX19225.1 histidine utilization repressor [Sphingomonas sp. Root1294]KQY65427.1 histidine utilization repressor [Sphingomonas sp. Root50]KRB95275.1 histidine utilization repressor [Sphingomonas sp. Root720]